MLKEGGEHAAVIDRVNRAKMSAGIMVFFEMRPVDHRHDPPGRLTIEKSDKRLNFIFKHQGRPLLVEHLEHLVVKRLDPARIAAWSAFPRRHESGDIGRALNLPHQQCGHAGPPCEKPGMLCMDGFALTSLIASSIA